MIVLKVLFVWSVASVLLGLVVGRFIHTGSGAVHPGFPKPEDFPRPAFRDCTILGMDVVDTCTSHPEQYDVFAGDERVGYLRQRDYFFYARLKDPSGPIVYSFESECHGLLEDHEREQVITDAVRALLDATAAN